MNFITWKQLSPIVGNKHPITVWRWERSGWFPPRVRIGPNSVGWKEDEVMEWAANPSAWRQRHQIVIFGGTDHGQF